MQETRNICNEYGPYVTLGFGVKRSRAMWNQQVMTTLNRKVSKMSLSVIQLCDPVDFQSMGAVEVATLGKTKWAVFADIQPEVGER